MTNETVRARIEALVITRPRAANAVAPELFRIAEASRLNEVKIASSAPSGCGDAIVDIAPARGPVERFTPREVIKTDAGNFRTVRTGWMGNDAIRRSDAFDVMEAQAARRARVRKRDHQPIFTQAQVNAGRAYSVLVERHAARGAKCSSVEATGGGAGGGSYVDRVVAEGRRLDAMRAAIGTDWAMTSRRAAPHGDRRRAIRVRTLVDLVCINGLTLSVVLDRFGWSRKTTHIGELRDQLCAALDRLHGL